MKGGVAAMMVAAANAAKKDSKVTSLSHVLAMKNMPAPVPTKCFRNSGPMPR